MMWWAIGSSVVALASILTAIFKSSADTKKLGAALKEITYLKEVIDAQNQELEALSAPLPPRDRMGGVLQDIHDNDREKPT